MRPLSAAIFWLLFVLLFVNSYSVWGGCCREGQVCLVRIYYCRRAAFAYSQNHYTNCIKTHSSVQFFSDGVTVVLKISIVYKRFLPRKNDAVNTVSFFQWCLLHKWCCWRNDAALLMKCAWRHICILLKHIELQKDKSRFIFFIITY